MPYILRSDGVNDRVTLPANVNVSNNCTVKIKFTGNDNAYDLYQNVLWGVNNGNRLIYGKNGNDNQLTIRAYNVNSDLVWTDATHSFTDPHEYKIVQDGTDTQLYVDDVLKATLTSDTRAIRTSSLCGISTYFSVMDLYYVEIDDTNTPSNNRQWNADSSSGTGSVLIDDLSNGNGTLVGFPTDDSQWVFIDDGGGAVELDFDGISTTSTLDSFSTTVHSNVLLDAIDTVSTVDDINLSLSVSMAFDDVHSSSAVSAFVYVEDAVTPVDLDLISVVSTSVLDPFIGAIHTNISLLPSDSTSVLDPFLGLIHTNVSFSDSESSSVLDPFLGSIHTSIVLTSSDSNSLLDGFSVSSLETYFFDETHSASTLTTYDYNVQTTIAFNNFLSQSGVDAFDLQNVINLTMDEINTPSSLGLYALYEPLTFFELSALQFVYLNDVVTSTRIQDNISIQPIRNTFTIN